MRQLSLVRAKGNTLMDIRLIATDLDGTLLDEEKKVPEENMAMLRKCAEHGIEIVPATGRTVKGIPETLKTLPGVRYVIATNGAVVADLKEDRILDTCRLPVEIAVKIMELARDSHDDIMYDAYIEGNGYTRQEFMDNIRRYVKTEGMVALVMRTRKAVSDSIAYVKEQGKPVDKINLYFADMDARARMRETLKGIKGILVSSSIPNNLEINAEGADKGSALLRLAELLHIKREETMAFGDGENDISMIAMAGIGVAMENGVDQVRAAADHVTGTNEEAGVAAAIRKFVFPPAMENGRTEHTGKE